MEIKVNDIPTKFKLYNVEIYVKPYTLKEIAEISILEEPDEILKAISKGIKVSGDIDSPLDLTLNDFIAAAAVRMINSGFDQYNIKSTCPHCNKVNYHRLVPDDIELKDIETPYIDFEYEGKKYRFAPHRVRRILEMYKSDTDANLAAILFIDSVDGRYLSLNEVLEVADQLPASILLDPDNLEIINEWSDYVPKVELVCTHCSKEYLNELNPVQLVKPFR